jgi:tRNA-dihydrouridine synthase
MSTPTLYLAPLRGVTGLTFRQAFVQHMTGLNLAVAPFIATTQGPKVKPEVLKSIDPTLQPPALPLVPQVIGKNPEQLRVMLKAMQALGYADVDLNAGCPWPFVAKKGRGSGLLKDEKVLAEMLAAGCETLGEGHFSIKVRLGLEDKELLLKRLDTIQAFPLREICIHPRTAKQMYEGPVDLDAFARVAERVTLPLVYNGDIRTYQDVERLQARFPQIHRWMIGRGIVANPFLAESIRAGKDTRDRERFLAWHATILEGYAATSCGDHALLGHMKELWSYLAPTFQHGDRLWDSLKLARTRDEFTRVLSLAPLQWKA